VVIVEQGGFGAGSAAPIARKIMEAAFNLNQDPAAAQQTHKPQTAL
ncbi:MAG: penicillin-binding protein 2, partial [Firmicutes bacterium]|nr:penicillin-binding protein 2 [Bacillota bacterium]